MLQIKIFSTENIESEINEWIEKTNADIRDIRIISKNCGYIIYIARPEPKKSEVKNLLLEIEQAGGPQKVSEFLKRLEEECCE